MRILSYILALCSLLSCTTPADMTPLLEQADRMMNVRPDSALALLESVPKTKKLSKKDWALWGLLFTQAQDKSYIKHTDDSLIRQSVVYFERNGSPLRLAQSLYYQGRVLQDLVRLEEATACYVRALDITKETENYHWLYLISSHLGTLYGRQNLSELAMETYRDTYRYAVLSEDSVHLSYAHSYLGRAYSLFREWEKSVEHYLQGAEIAECIGHEPARFLALQECASVYVRMDRFEEAKRCYNRMAYDQQSNEIKKRSFSHYLSMGELYRQTNQMDSAVFFLQKALTLRINHTTRQGVYLSFSLLYEEQGDYEKALQYTKKYKILTDSIQRANNQAEIAKISTRYENEKIQKENIRLELRNLQLGMGAATGLFILVAILLFIIRFFRRQMQISQAQMDALRAEMTALQQETATNLQKIREYQVQITTLSTALEHGQQEYDWLQRVKQSLEVSGVQYQQELDEFKKRLEEKSAYIEAIKENRLLLLDETRELSRKNEELSATIRSLQQRLQQGKREKAEWTQTSVSCTLLVKIQKEGYTNLTKEEWQELFAITNAQHQNFVRRLLAAYPRLSDEDVKLCCLTKLGFTHVEIADLLDVYEDTLTKRKQRFKEKFGLKKWEDKGGFVGFIERF